MTLNIGSHRPEWRQYACILLVHGLILAVSSGYTLSTVSSILNSQPLLVSFESLFQDKSDMVGLRLD